MKTGGVELWEGGGEQRMEEDGAREISKRLFSFHSSVRNWSGACEIIVFSFKLFQSFEWNTRVRSQID